MVVLAIKAPRTGSDPSPQETNAARAGGIGGDEGKWEMGDGNWLREMPMKSERF